MLFELNDIDVIDERGNTWLIADEEGWHAIWIDNGENSYLEITVTPCNYPGFQMAVIERTPQQLAEHIHKNCNGWLVRKCNIPDVVIEHERIAYEEEDDE